MRPRNRLLVDPEVQYSIGARIVFHWVMFVGSLVLFGAAVRMITMAGEMPLTSAMALAFKTQVPVIMIAALLVPVFLRDTLRLSNRFAGPMYRLRQSIKAFSNGEPHRPLKFRPTDFWQPAAEEFNVVMAQFEELRRRNQALEAELAQVYAEREEYVS